MATRGDLAELLRLAVPVTAVQVGMMLMGVVDTLMVGRVSADALAAAALGNLYWWSVCGFFFGLLMSLDPIVTQAVGAKDSGSVRRGVQRGIVLATGLTILASLLLLPARRVLELMGQPPHLAEMAGRYATICIAGLWPFLIFAVFRQVLQAMHRLKALVIAILVGNGMNVVVNWVLIFGHFGIEPMGLEGSAWATVFSRWIMTAALTAAAWNHLRGDLWPWNRLVLKPGPLWKMIKIGAPIGGQITLESGVFTVVGLLMGAMGSASIAAHQIALNLASLTFMVPLGIGQAATVQVGRGIGAADMPAARRAAMAAFTLGATFMALSCLVFLAMPRLLAMAYIQEAAVVELAATLIPIAGVFQVFDGLQTVGNGVLRGAGDTRAPLIINMLGFWLIGLPASLALAFTLGGGAAGLWWGFVAGLAVVAALQVWRSKWKLSGNVERIRVDHGP